MGFGPSTPTSPACTQAPSRQSIGIMPEAFARIHLTPLTAAYRIESTLRLGSSANVYLATHLATGQTRTVKTIQKESLSLDQLLALKSDALKVASLDHPHIIKIFDIYEDEATLMVVNDYCSGGELLERVFRRGRTSERNAAEYVHQIVSAVGCCHENGIVLREIRPDHILFVDSKESSGLRLQALRLPVHAKSSYSMAPELIAGEEASPASDIFCCGVLAYVLICGTPPTLNTARDFQRCFSRPEVAHVSEDCKELLRRALARDPGARPTAIEMLAMKWLQNRAQRREDTHLAASVLTNMKNFRASVKLEQAALRFIANQLATSGETEHLRRVFRALDLNGDGKLSKEELAQGYKSLNLASPAEVDRIMAVADSDHNGYLNYLEFITAAMNWRKELCEAQLTAAFQAFDTDGNGKITVQELKAMFIGNEDRDESVWVEMMQEVDRNHDGEIDLEEFRSLVMRKISTALR